jgi:predicted NUDIX family NTP pyrophosphohydrolase
MENLMAKLSAGIVLYRRMYRKMEIFLVHPGGPFWKNKDEGAWSIPKGEYQPGEDALTAAHREFEEETGAPAPQGRLVPLGEVRQAGGKTVTAWAVEGDIDANAIQSNSFEMEWPPKSGKTQQFPEIDRAGWFDLDRARDKVLAAQRAFLDRLEESID